MRTLQKVTAKYNVTKDSIMEQALQMAPVKIPQKPAITSNPSPNKRAAPKSVTESPLPKKIRTVATLERPANTYRVPHLNKPALGSLAGEVLSEIGAAAVRDATTAGSFSAFGVAKSRLSSSNFAAL